MLKHTYAFAPLTVTTWHADSNYVLESIRYPADDSETRERKRFRSAESIPRNVTRQRELLSHSFANFPDYALYYLALRRKSFSRVLDSRVLLGYCDASRVSQSVRRIVPVTRRLARIFEAKESVHDCYETYSTRDHCEILHLHTAAHKGSYPLQYFMHPGRYAHSKR